MHRLLFVQVAKRINSTYNPFETYTIDQISPIEVCYKQNTSTENPIVQIDWDYRPPWNYCKDEDTGRLYWVTDVVSVRQHGWEIHLTVDALATYKKAIMATRAIIMYGFNSNASGAGLRLRDARQYVAQRPTITSELVDVLDGLFSSAGTYLLSCVGKDGLATYALSYAGLQSLLTQCSQDWSTLCEGYTSWEDAIPEFMNKFVFSGSAIENVRSCVYVPFDSGKYTGSSVAITLGNFDTGVSATAVNASDIFDSRTDIAIPWPATDWRRMNCQVQLYVPFFGIIGIPVDQCNNQDSVTVQMGVSLIDGGISCYVRAGQYAIYSGSTNVASSYGIGVSNIDFMGAASSALGVVGSAMQFGAAVHTGNVLGAARAGLDVANGVVQTIAPQQQCIGGMSGRSQISLPRQARLSVLYYQPVDNAGYQGLYGYPVFRVATPVKGYCQTNGFSVAAQDATSTEIDYINSAMDGGVFIE